MTLRAPPAYQEYASDLLANETIKVMSLDELGLLTLMRWQSWVSDSIPSDANSLARVVGRNVDDVSRLLTPNVLSFFCVKHEDDKRLECPELRDYKLGKAIQRAMKSDAGRKGAASLHGKLGPSLKGQASAPAGKVPWHSAMAAPEKRRAEPNREEPSRTAKNRSIAKNDSVATVGPDETAEYARAFGDELAT